MCAFHCNVSKNKYSAYLQPIIETGSWILSESKPMFYCFLASDLFRSWLFVRDQRHRRVTTLHFRTNHKIYGYIKCSRRTFGRPLHWLVTSIVQWKIWCRTPFIKLPMAVAATLLGGHLILRPNIFETRLHSSRMHTAHLLTISPSMHCTGGVPALGGCLLGGVPVPGVGGGCLLPGGCLLRGVCLLLGGVCSWGGACSHGGGIPSCTEPDTPPLNRILHAPENITLPQTSFADGKYWWPHKGGLYCTIKVPCKILHATRKKHDPLSASGMYTDPGWETDWAGVTCTKIAVCSQRLLAQDLFRYSKVEVESLSEYSKQNCFL